MAKQSGTVFFEGTIDDLTFYKMNGKYYVRKKSRLTGKRVKKDPQFENSRRNAKWFGQAAQLASKVYRQLPADHKFHGKFGDMTAMASCFVRAGLSAEEIIAKLRRYWLPKAAPMPGESCQPAERSLAVLTVDSKDKIHNKFPGYPHANNKVNYSGKTTPKNEVL
jgi:hypothetical protein